MKIAIIGYGSLIWDIECLAPHVRGDWHLGGGPALPVEFSRISPKRKQALVLVVDEMLEHKCPTNVIESSRNQLDLAIADLAARERCGTEMIRSCLRSQPVESKAGEAVSGWLEACGFDAAIWTGLAANFERETGAPFSHSVGLDYLQTLRGEALSEAWRYITFAPDQTDTPFRRFLLTSDFWQKLSAREASRAT